MILTLAYKYSFITILGNTWVPSLISVPTNDLNWLYDFKNFMIASSQQSTKPSKNAQTSSVVDEFLSEESLSEHSFDEGRYHKLHAQQYISTNLITERNITLADVMSETITLPLINDRRRMLIQRTGFRHNPLGTIDPRAILRSIGKDDEVDTLVPYDDIGELC